MFFTDKREKSNKKIFRLSRATAVDNFFYTPPA
jgi:hypothetical protein